jgi:hypothetical protein
VFPLLSRTTSAYPLSSLAFAPVQSFGPPIDEAELLEELDELSGGFVGHRPLASQGLADVRHAIDLGDVSENGDSLHETGEEEFGAAASDGVTDAEMLAELDRLGIKLSAATAAPAASASANANVPI